MPIEANGDRDLIDRLSKLPIDKQPFWFINWQALEEHRKNPQSYPQRPNVFVDTIPQSNSGVISSQKEFAASTQGSKNNQDFGIGQQGFAQSSATPQGSASVTQGFIGSNQGVRNNQGFSTNNQGISNIDSGFANSQVSSSNSQVLFSPGFSSHQESFSHSNSFPNVQTSSQNNNKFVNSNHGLSKPSSGFTNSINGFVLTDPALVYTNTENNFGTQNNDNVSGNSNQVFASTSSRPSNNQQIFKIPHHGFTTIKQGFFNQNPGLVTSSIATPNKGSSSTSSGFTSKVAISNSKPGINSRFSAQSASQSSSSSTNDKVGDAHNYSYHWNNSYSNSYKYTYNYTTHSVIPVPQ